MKKIKIILICLVGVLIMILALSTTYALFNMNITKDKIFKVATGTLELRITDAEEDGSIVINNLVPMKEQTGLNQEGYTFTLTNTGTIPVSYTMYLDDVVLDTLPTGIDGRIDNNLVWVNLYDHSINTSKTMKLSDLTNRVLTSGKLDTGSNKQVQYTLKVWLDYDADNSAQNKYFGLKIRADGVQFNENINASNILINSSNTNCTTVQCAIDELADIY